MTGREMDAWRKNTLVSVEDAHLDTVPSTEYDSLKNIAEIEMILLGYNEEYLHLNEKWNNLRKYHEETLMTVTKVKEYKEVLLGELFEIERECESLNESRKKVENEVVSDQCRDILDLTCALRRLANREKIDDRSMICSSKFGEKVGFTKDSIGEVCDSRLLIKSAPAEASDFALLADGHEDASIAESVLKEERNFATEYEQEITKVASNLNNERRGRNEAAKTSEKPQEELARHSHELGEIIEQNKRDETVNIECAATSNETRASIVGNSTNWEPNLVKVKVAPTTKPGKGGQSIGINSYSSESLSSDGDDTTGNVPHQETVDYVTDEIQLANELEIALNEHEKARGEVIKETVNTLKKLREEEVYLKKKLNMLMTDCLSISQGNNDTAQLTLDKNITGVKSKLKVIDCKVRFVKMESDHKLDRIKINFELRALAERVQLAKAVELLSQLRKPNC